MRAAVIYGAGDVRVENVPDPVVGGPGDALVDVTHSCICGSDLWPYGDMEPVDSGRRIGHEFIGRVRDVGPDVRTVHPGDMVVAPFRISCGTCEFCRAGLHTSCVKGGAWGYDTDGGQGEAVRVPLADGTLVRLPVESDDDRMASLLALSDVMGTGHHAALGAGVRTGGSVAVVGDGAVGLCAVIAAKRLGAERIIILGRHADRTNLAGEFGATDVVAARGEDAVHAVRELTGHGVDHVVEAVGTDDSWRTAMRIVRPGGRIGFVGVPHLDGGLPLRPLFVKNVGLGGGMAPARAYIDELLPDVLDGTIEPGRVFDRTIGLEEIPDGYRAMAGRDALKVMIHV
ncbi:zinc-dependent alcohol dehydrogenase family protein [Spelaeicoccus albus]|uniref:Threonine dehydrogenase-like Zn-dependent dehydrogenase n=1 Tax=Spelaeicoccus albus TaxID=1280376 RepID=A0A7Z0AA36_9MICO|nr:zinc-dependent alcohol dehydrogenase family protein [Spelaeicoccus albus]NYI66363.1 hypothetical protein [Spelaeicoccus albus]